MSVVVSTFPSLNSFNSRSWTLVAIIALHVGFFWLLSSGGIAVIYPPARGTQLVPVDIPKPPPPTPRTIDIDHPTPIQGSVITITPPADFELEPQENVSAGEVTTTVTPTVTGPATREPVTTQPTADPRIGLSEPPYPASERRDGHQGTVILAIEVLENGRVGQVRIESSSGYQRLDEAAVRQAQRWRLKPGMRDGVPVVMWKRIPVHFRLTPAGERF